MIVVSEGSSVEKDKEWIHPHINKIASSDNGGNTQWLKQCVAGDRMCFLWLLLISFVRWNGDISGLHEQLGSIDLLDFDRYNFDYMALATFKR